jgi:5S rRNA maturation endonuclease (ribonuclease M5)
VKFGIENLSAYGEYRRRLDAREVLARYGAQNCTEQINRKDGTTEIVHSCLLDRVEPHHKNHDANPSAWCNVDKNLYVCSSYWSGDLLHLIQKLEGKENLSEVLPTVGEMLRGATQERDQFAAHLQKLFTAHEIYDAEIPTYSPQVLNPWSASHPYMREERGISQEVHQRLRIGYDPAENRIVIPHFWEGQLVGWQKRAIPERPLWPGTMNPFPKYRSSTGFPKSDTLYGFDYASRGHQIVVVESPMSVARAHSLGITNVTATFGAKVSRHQIEMLTDFGEIIVWFDHDPAGYHGARQLVEGLQRHTKVLVVDPDEGSDLADYPSAEAVCAKLETARPAALWLAALDLEEAR